MWFLALASICFSLSAHSSITVTSKIHDIDYGQGGEDDYLMLKSGHVVWLKKATNKSVSHSLQLERHSDRLMNFTLNDQNELISVTEASSPLENEPLLPLEENINSDYTPTILENLEAANKLYQESRYVAKESQCYNRAHVWSYEWFEKHGVKSNKAWLFFTRRYIRKFKFDWWFHVAPSVAVKERGIVKEKVIDLKYSHRGAINLKEWTNIFLKDDAQCPLVQKYSDYANYPESGSCFTMRTSMYYYQPFDIETQENWGTARTNWFESDIRGAYLEAFDEEI